MHVVTIQYHRYDLYILTAAVGSSVIISHKFCSDGTIPGGKTCCLKYIKGKIEMLMMTVRLSQVLAATCNYIIHAKIMK